MALETIISTVYLDVYDHDTTPSTIKTIALDSQTRYVQAYLQKRGEVYQPDLNATVRLIALRPDKIGVEATGSVIELVPAGDGDEAVYGLVAEITQAMIAVPGTVLFQFKMEVNNEILRTEIFKANNGVALDGSTSEWAEEYQGYNLDELVEEIADLKGNLSDVEDRVTALEQGGGVSGLTSEAKNAILACFRGAAWRGDVDAAALYSALDTALNPPANLSSISAVYTQSGPVDVGDSLDSLRNGLVVTAHYTDGTTLIVTSYTLSGQLTLGTSTITVTYGGKTATFTVTVSSTWEYVWDLTQSLTDTVGGMTAVASAGTGVEAPVITSSGIVFNAATQRLLLGDISLDGKTIEIDVESFDFKGSTSSHIRFLLDSSNTGPIVYHKSSGWSAYGLSSSGGSTAGWASNQWTSGTDRTNRNLFNGKTVKLVSETNNIRSLYLDGDLLGTMDGLRYSTGTQALAIGASDSYAQSSGDQCYDMTISAIRIKTNPVAEGGDE